MVISPTISSSGGSMLLRAESIYQKDIPNWAAVQNVVLSLWTGATAPPDKKEAVLFKEADLVPWIVFTVVFFVLVVFDNLILHRKAQKLTLLQSMLYTTFWIAVACMFNVYVFITRGSEDAVSWGTGYILEWMLSVDNLFVFHRIFILFETPDEQKHKPLFYGIMGAIVFRMIFFLVEELLLHHVTWMHLVFGIFLIYTGIKAVSMGDDDEDQPNKNCLYEWLKEHINYVDRYDEHGNFFTKALPSDSPRPSDDAVDVKANVDEEDPTKKPKLAMETCRATRLVLVVVCLEVTDLVFAVDSVSAIVAQIPDLFLAYTACVFAMLGLRAMFFAIDELVKMFSLLAYGVAFILVFLGVKLILRSWIHVPPTIVCVILVSTLAISIAASVFAENYQGSDKIDAGEVAAPDPENTDRVSAVA